MKIAPSILVIGGARVERSARSDAPVCPGQTHRGAAHEAIGGSGFAATAALASVGSPSALISARGGDEAGAIVARAVERLGARDFPCTWLDRQTPTHIAICDHDGTLVASVFDDRLYDHAGTRLIRRTHVRAIIAAADAVLVDANYGEPLYRQLADRYPDKPIAAIGVSPEKVARLRPLVDRLAILFVSRAEAAALAGLPAESDATGLAQTLAALGVRSAVITDDARPTLVLEKGTMRLQAGAPVDDSSRDALAAIAFLAIAEGQPMEQAARLGLAAASLQAAGKLEMGGRAACEARARDFPPVFEPA